MLEKQVLHFVLNVAELTVSFNPGNEFSSVRLTTVKS